MYLLQFYDGSFGFNYNGTASGVFVELNKSEARAKIPNDHMAYC